MSVKLKFTTKGDNTMSKSVVKSFIEEHSNMFYGCTIVRGLYLRDDCNEIFVMECEEWKSQRKTFVFEFCCGYFESCKTEINVMEKYLMDISKVDHAEYTAF